MTLTVTQTLDDPKGRTSFLDAITDYGNVLAACEALGLSRGSVYRYAATHPDFDEAFEKAHVLAARMHRDECYKIADDPALDPRDKHVRIDTRLRIAGKLDPRFLDRPQTEVNVTTNVGIVCDEKQRRRLIDLNERLRNTPAHERLAAGESAKITVEEPHDEERGSQGSLGQT